MTQFLRPGVLVGALAIVAAALSTPALASSTAASSASDSVSTSLGAMSTSLGHSSDSSTKPLQANAGDYRVVDVAEVADRPERVRLTLRGQTEGATDEFHLFLPRETVAQATLAAGDVITARTRVYGVEFARAQAAEPFFLVLHDAWYRQLATHPVTL
jgi:hypothetical protein